VIANLRTFFVLFRITECMQTVFVKVDYQILPRELLSKFK